MSRRGRTEWSGTHLGLAIVEVEALGLVGLLEMLPDLIPLVLGHPLPGARSARISLHQAAFGAHSG